MARTENLAAAPPGFVFKGGKGKVERVRCEGWTNLPLSKIEMDVS